MSNEVSILKSYIELLEKRRLLVAASLLSDNSPDDLQINTAAKNANNFVQISAGIAAASQALANLTGQAYHHKLDSPIPIAPMK